MAEESRARTIFSAIGEFIRENRAPIAAVLGVGAAVYVVHRGVKSGVQEGYKLGLAHGRERCDDRIAELEEHQEGEE